MPSSMTGFGQADADGYHVEIRGVNHRYKEIRVKVPRDAAHAEMYVRGAVNEAIQRGKVDVTITVNAGMQELPPLNINWDLAQAWYENLRRMAERFGGEVSFRDLMLIPGVAGEKELTTNDRWSLIKGPLEAAVRKFLDSRLEEGTRLRQDMLMRVDAIQAMCATVEDLAADMPKAYQDKLKTNLENLMTDKSAWDEVRLAQEVAIMAERCDITEEVVRLKSHLGAFKEVLDSQGAIGRRLDFMLQEINREWNTIGSKSQILAISHLVIDAKTELEKIREQVQNIE